MKKLLFFSTFALLVCACAKNTEFSDSKGSFTMKIGSSYDDSKTAITFEDGVYKPYWTAGDDIKVLEFSGETLLQNKASEALEEDAYDAEFTVQLDTPEGSDFKYYAVYPASSYGYSSTGDFYRLELPSNQTFSKTSFGPKSDLLISSSDIETMAERPSSIHLKFKRIGAVVGITVKGMTAGEQIESATISTTDNYISGYSKYNPTTAEWQDTYSSSSKSISTTPVEIYTTTGEDIIWFRTYGTTLENDLTVTVTTDKTIYSKTIDLAGSGKTIEFKEGGMTKFSVNNLTAKSRSETKYARVTSIDQIAAGDEIIFVAYVSKDAKYYAAGELSGAILSNVDATADGSFIKSDDALVFTLGRSDDNWTFSTEDGKLGATAEKKLAFDNGTTTWSISFSNDFANISSTKTDYGTMKYNSSSPRFTTYKSGQTSIYLYAKVKTLKSLAVSGTPDKTEYFAGDTFNPEGLVATAYYSNDTQADVTKFVTWSFDPETLSAGDTSCDVVATYKEVESESYTVSGLTVITEPQLQSISVSGTPDEFWKGDTFNHNGMTVMAHYDVGEDVDVTDDSSFQAPDMKTTGTKTVTVAYKSKETSYEIEVKTIANTKETAYTTAEAITIITNGKDLASRVYVKGIISKIDSYNQNYGSIQYWLDDNAFEVYAGLGLDSTKFSSKNDLSVKDSVIVFGNIKKYGSTYEFDKNNYLVQHTPAATLSIADLTVKNGDAINPVIVTNVDDGYTISYESDNTDVVSVNGTTLTTEGTGTANITATLTKDGYLPATTTFKVTVTSAATLSSIEISGTPSKTSYNTGDSFDCTGLTATGHFSDETTQDLTSVVTWSSDPETFDEGGTVDVTVKAQYESIEGTKVYQVTVTAAAKTWTYTVSSGTSQFKAGTPITINNATWSIVMGDQVGSPSVNGTATKYSGIYGWKWGHSSSNYWKSYTLSTDYFTGKKVSKVVVKFLNNGKKSATMTVTQGNTTIGSETKEFATTWTDLTANKTKGSSGVLNIQYSVAQASYINSITVEYYD